MGIEVCTIGGFTKTAGNSVAVKIDDEVIILDMGLSMENYIRFGDDREDASTKTYDALLEAGAVPNYGLVDDWKTKVKAIIPSHAHLDHIGAVPFAASLYPMVPIICTPFTAQVLKTIFYDERIKSPNRIISVNLNSSYKVTPNITAEFIHITHSIPHTAVVVLHTPYGKVMYANDYKFDLQPVVGKRPNFERLTEIGKEGGVKLLIMECLYAHEHRKMPSESVAKQMLKDVLFGVPSEGKVIIVTTFSSHIARLKTIIEMGKKLNRKVIVLGRSLTKYIKAAEKIELVNFEKDALMVSYRDQIEKTLEKIQKTGKDKYLIICTGHQGEPKAMLSKMVRGELAFNFESGDIVVFSCSVIPVELNQQNRDVLEQGLQAKGVRIFRDVHVSGHAAREDHRDMLEMVKPQYIIPAHAGADKAQMLAELAESLGYKNTKIMKDGERFVVPE